MPPRQGPISAATLEKQANDANNQIQQRLACAAQLAEAAGRHTEALGAMAEKIAEKFGALDLEAVPTTQNLMDVKDAMLEFIDVTSQHAHAVRVCASACHDVARNSGYSQGAFSMPLTGAPPRSPAAPRPQAAGTSAASSAVAAPRPAAMVPATPPAQRMGPPTASGPSGSGSSGTPVAAGTEEDDNME